MSDDLVKRLREADVIDYPNTTQDLCEEGATRILELEEMLAKAREALEFYGRFHECPDKGPWGVDSIDFGDRARQALKDTQP